MEVMLSAFVLSVGVVGIMPLFISSFRDSLDSRDQVIASMLAQEGVELVQNFRDTNKVSGASGGVFDGTNFPTFDSDNCWVSYDNSGINCTGTYQLNLTANNFYTHDTTGTLATKFQRKIGIKYSPASSNNVFAQKVTITSMVIWGVSFPGDISNCNTAHKCVYTSLILTKW